MAGITLTEGYLGDNINVAARRYRDGTLTWTVTGACETRDTATDTLVRSYAVEALYDMTDPVNVAAVTAVFDPIAAAIATNFSVDVEKLGAPGTPGTPPLTLTEDYLGDAVYLPCRRARDATSGLLVWSITGACATYDEATDEKVLDYAIDDLEALLSSGEQDDFQDFGAAIQLALATELGVLEEKP
jgi:hypothetical protein